jgi:DDE superfamily endonuclease
VTTVRQTPDCFGLSRTRWRLCDLRAVLPWLAEYSDAGVSLALKRQKIRLKRGRLRLHSPDPAYTTKLAWIARAVDRAQQEPQRSVLIWGDEVSIYRQPTLADQYFPLGEAPVITLSHKANTRFRLSGGLDHVTGTTTYRTGSKLTIPKLRQFLAALRERYPDKELILVWDNWPVHQHPEVLAQASTLGIEILWLPTYAPWTNPIEKLWRWMRQEAVHCHRHADEWEELKGAVTGFLDQFADGSTALLRYVGLLPD